MIQFLISSPRENDISIYFIVVAAAYYYNDYFDCSDAFGALILEDDAFIERNCSVMETLSPASHASGHSRRIE